MAVSAACIAAVVDASGGKVTDREATELIRYMETLRDAEVAKGNLDDLERRVMAAAAQGAERTRIAALVARRHAAQAAIAHAAALDHLDGLKAAGLSHADSARAFLVGTVKNVEGGRNSIAAVQVAYLDRYTQGINLLFTRDPEVGRRLRDADFNRNVRTEMREMREGGTPGSTKDRAALALAKEYAAAAEMARLDLNRHGGTIGKLDGWDPQFHDPSKLVRITAEEWADFILPRLDLDRSFGGMSEAGARAELVKMHDRIVTGMDPRPPTEIPQGRVGPANLANSISAARELHFRDSEGATSYADRFGSDVHSAMRAHLTRASRNAGLMERLGPNPGVGWANVLTEWTRRAGTDPALDAAARGDVRKKLTAARGNWNSPVGNAWLEVSGQTSSPVDVTFAKIGEGVRFVQTTAKLGGAVLSSILNDLVPRAMALTEHGVPIHQAWGQNIRELARGRGDGEAREIAAVLGAGVDGMHGHLIVAGMAEDAQTGVLHRLTTTFFRWQGMTWQADAFKAGMARMIARRMGQVAESAWDALSPTYRRILRQQGLRAAEWDAIRATAYDADGARYVTPDRVKDVPDAVVLDLARERINAEQAGLGDRLSRRMAADKREADWAKTRIERFDAELRADRQRWEGVSEDAAVSGESRKLALRLELDALRARMHDLRTWTEAVARGEAPLSGKEGGAAPIGTPADERVLHVGDSATVAARSEGELRGRIGQVRRAIGRVAQEVSRADARRLEGFEATWTKRRGDLDAFLTRMEERAGARGEANTADNAGWSDRVEAIVRETRTDLEVKLRRLLADELRFGFLEPGTDTRAMTLQATRPGTAMGELLRAVMQFKSFPVTYTNRVLGRAYHGFRAMPGEEGASSALTQSAHVGTLIASTFLMGYLTMSLKDISRGWEPRDLSDWKTWIAAMQQGGGAGIYGDFLFSQANRFGNSALETVAGPIGSTIASIANFGSRVVSGEVRAKEGLDLAFQNTPFLSLWFARPVLDYLVLNALREQASPGFLHRQERTRRKDYGQERLFGGAVRNLWE